MHQKDQKGTKKAKKNNLHYVLSFVRINHSIKQMSYENTCETWILDYSSTTTEKSQHESCSSLVIYSRTLTLRVTRLSICERRMAPPFAVEVKLNKFSEYWFETLQLINENVFCGVFGTKQSLISWILQTILFGSFCSDALLWSGAEGWHFICRPFAEGRKKS